MFEPYIEVGDKFTYTPEGQWMHKIWQSKTDCICSGVKRLEDGSREYRFTMVGDASILLPGKGYNDIKLLDRQLFISFRECDDNEVSTLNGWLGFVESAHLKDLAKFKSEQGTGGKTNG